MLTLYSQPAPKDGVRLHWVAVGNAGCNRFDRLALEAGGSLPGTALNTDAANLQGCVAPEKILLGEKFCRGLGCGGDPESGLAAWTESSDRALSCLDDADVVVFLAGLGGGTASALLPELTTAALARGLHVIHLVTLPFQFEGVRRNRQAAETLAALYRPGVLTLAFPLDGLGDLNSSTGPVSEAFAESDQLLTGVAAALHAICQSTGPLEVSVGDLFGLLGGGKQSWFSHASTEGSGRAANLVPQLLKSPFLRQAPPLENASHVLAYLRGGSDLSLAEVETIVKQLQRELGSDLHLQIGLSTASTPAPGVALSLLGIQKATRPAEASRPPAATHKPAPAPTPTSTEPAPPPANLPLEEAAEPPASSAQPDLIPDFTEQLPSPPSPPLSNQDQSELFTPTELPPPPPRQAPPPKKSPPKVKQEVLPLESASRGRFDKSEPTIVEGEDLDVPTFLRWKIKLK